MFWWYAKWHPAGKRTFRCETAIGQERRQAASDVLLPQSDRILCSSGNINHCGFAAQWFAGKRLDSSAFLKPSVPSFLRVTKNDSADPLKRYGHRILNETWRCRERSIGCPLHYGLVECWQTRAHRHNLCHLTASNWYTRHPPYWPPSNNHEQPIPSIHIYPSIIPVQT